MIRTCKLFYGKLKEPVTAKLCVAEDFRDAYIIEAYFEETGELFSEHGILQLEEQNQGIIQDECEVFHE